MPKRLTLTTKHYRFEPRWSLTLLTLLLLALFLRMGFWQLERAKEKEMLTQRFEAGLNAPPISLDTLPLDPGDWEHVPITVTGIYDNAHPILLDNKIHAHRVGYEVLTPLYIPEKRRTVLINRGWIPAPSERSILPAIPEVKGEQTLTGMIYLPSEKSLRLKHIEEPPNTWPLRVQTLTVTELKKRFNTPLYPFVIRLKSDAKDGFVRDWQPVNLPPYKHIGYAVQWFTFALVLIIIFIALNIRKNR